MSPSTSRCLKASNSTSSSAPAASALRGGNHEGHAGGGGRGRAGLRVRRQRVARARAPGEPARLAAGAARPARRSEGYHPDGCGHRTGVLPRIARARDAEESKRSWIRRSIAWSKQGLLLRHGVAPDATYVFKHALCQDVAYGTLLSEPRRALHARIAEAMEFHSPDLATTEPEVLARHYTQAGLTEKAAVFWAKAGRHSLARSALAEAEPQLERAIALVADLPGSPAVGKLQKELRADLAKVKAQRDAVSLSSPPPTKHTL